MTAHWGEAEALAFVAAHDLGTGLRAKRLAGGYWNDVLRVETGDRVLVLKHYVEVLDGTLFPNLPDHEAYALQRLAPLAVAPRPLGYWPEARVLAYEFVEGPEWADDVEAVADLLRRKEAASSEGFRPVPVEPEAILAQGQALLDRCRMGEMFLIWRAAKPRPVPVSAPPRLSLIHTDIGAGNLVCAGSGLRLIDWQCPAAGDLAEDIFSFLSPAFQILNHREPLSPAQRTAFFDALGLPGAAERHAMLERFHGWRMGAYCCLRADTATDPAVVARYRAAAAAELGRILERA